ncbi:MAG: FAD binding domain-containing protein [Gemmatimonadaceae bacterium]|nr:FAD binding domain-containing protein [Gemmatimonadaceae bacterium]
MGLTELNLRSASNLDEALKILREEPRRPVAGATDVYVALNFGTTNDRRFLDIWALEELRGISVNRDSVVVGALTTYTELLRSPEIQKRFPMLVAASQLVGGAQIQNRGTIGGNVANASPAGDSLPVLFVAEAVIVTRSVDGERRIPITEFYTGYRMSVLKPDELIVAVEIPAVEGQQKFRKVGTRAAQAISKVAFAGVRGPNGPRLSYGSVGPTVVRVPNTEKALASGASIDEAVNILSTEIKPIDDVRSTGDYRMRVAANLLRWFWKETAPQKQ